MNRTVPTDNSPKLKCPWCIPGIDNCHCSQEEIKKYYEQQAQIDSEESPYCAKCGSCGETGCCPPINCEEVVCKYGEINLKDYKCFQDQWEVMYNTLKELWEFNGNTVARDALNQVDKLWDKLYDRSSTSEFGTITDVEHEPAVAVHDVFSQPVPGAFGISFLHRLIGKPNSKE